MPTLANENHELFAINYIATGNQVKSYQAVYPNASYTSAKSQGYILYHRPDIKDRIAELRDELAEELKERTRQSKEAVIERLLQSAEEAKAAGSFAAYAKMQEMIIRMCGFYAPEQHTIDNNMTWTLKFPGIDDGTQSNPSLTIPGKIVNELEEQDLDDDEDNES